MRRREGYGELSQHYAGQTRRERVALGVKVRAATGGTAAEGPTLADRLR